MVGGAAVGRLGLRSDLSGITLPGTIAPMFARRLRHSRRSARDGTASFSAQSRTAAVPPSSTAFKRTSYHCRMDLSSGQRRRWVCLRDAAAAT